MNMANREAVFEEKLAEYLKAGKGRKSEILKSVCDVTSLHRKAAIRKFRRLQMNDPYLRDARGRPTYYTPDVDAALKDVWDASNELCGELLHGEIGEYVRILIRDGDWKHSDAATAKLYAMGKRTVRRRCESFEGKWGWGNGDRGNGDRSVFSRIFVS